MLEENRVKIKPPRADPNDHRSAGIRLSRFFSREIESSPSKVNNGEITPGVTTFLGEPAYVNVKGRHRCREKKKGSPDKAVPSFGVSKVI